MTKTAALYDFFQSFGIPFYPTTSVPDDVIFPYGTYEPVTASWGDGEQNITVNLWYYTESEAIPNAKVDEISKYIGLGGVQIPCDEGTIWIKKGMPFSQNIFDSTAPGIKRRYLNITAEFNTLY